VEFTVADGETKEINYDNVKVPDTVQFEAETAEMGTTPSPVPVKSDGLKKAVLIRNGKEVKTFGLAGDTFIVGYSKKVGGDGCYISRDFYLCWGVFQAIFGLVEILASETFFDETKLFVNFPDG
jgi:hypothetical protein